MWASWEWTGGAGMNEPKCAVPINCVACTIEENSSEDEVDNSGDDMYMLSIKALNTAQGLAVHLHFQCLATD